MEYMGSHKDWKYGTRYKGYANIIETCDTLEEAREAIKSYTEIVQGKIEFEIIERKTGKIIK